MSRRLEVFLHGEPVGHLSELPGGGSEFRVTHGYQTSHPRPVLGQSFEDSDLERPFRNRKRQSLPDFFANLVPEGRLRDILEDAANLTPGDDLALLAFVGQDLPGAITLRNEPGVRDPLPLQATARPTEIDAENLDEALHFSLAGVQLKFSMLRDEDKLTLPARGESGEWIVKFDSQVFPGLAANEFSMLEWARAADFEVPECHLHAIDDVVGSPRRYFPDGTQVLAVRRYDRTPQGRVHQEDFAQAVGLPPRRKYDQVTYEAMALLAARFTDDEGAVDEMVRRLVFVIASGNNDAHLKNWSLIYPDRIHARWAPLYDQVATIAWSAPARELSLKLAGVKEFGRIDRAAFERFAQKVAREPAEVLALVDETLERICRAWRARSESWPLHRDHAQAVIEHWKAVPLLAAADPLGT